MEISISILSDASKAVEGLVDAMAKIGRLFEAAALTGVEIVGFVHTHESIKHLIDLSSTLTFLTQHQRAEFLPTLQHYADNSTDENWAAVQTAIDDTLHRCKNLIDSIDENRRDIATKEFFATLLGALMERDHTLIRLRDGVRPQSSDALVAFRQHVVKYIKLLDQISTSTASLNAYIDSLKAKNI
jgi:hypothetical protein